MEAVGLAASIATMFELGVKIIKISRRLSKAAKSIPHLENDILDVIAPLKLSGLTIKSAYKKLKEREDPDTHASTVLKHVIDGDVIQALEGCSERIIHRLAALPDEVQSLDSRIKVFATMKWQSSKPKFDLVAFMAEQVKTSVMLVFHTAQIEILMILWKRADGQHQQFLEKEIYATRKDLRVEEQTAKDLRGRNRRISDDADRGFLHSMSRVSEALNSLEKLSGSMRKDANRLVGDSRSSIHSSDRQGSLRSASLSSKEQTVVGKHTQSRQHSPSTGAPVSPATESEVEPSKPQPAGSSISSSPSSPSSPSLKSPVSGLICDWSKIQKSTGGYLTSPKRTCPTERSQVTALVSSGGAFNTISIHKAQELDLEIRDLEANDPTDLWIINEGTNKISVIGKIHEAVWRHSQAYDVYQILEFWVVDSAHHGVVLGKNFQQGKMSVGDVV